MFVARSKDGGTTFLEESPAFDKPTGASACCGTKAQADDRGNLLLLYRAATANVNRDIVLLTSNNNGASFRGGPIHPWRIAACPMSSASLARSESGLVAAWETSNRVYFSHIDPETAKVTPPMTRPG
jgi:hypothetical protein